MNNLTSIVPPLELCKQIPKDKFTDSALGYEICNRGYKDEYANLIFRRDEPEYPAPTLAEIITDLDEYQKDKNGDFRPLQIQRDFGVFFIGYPHTTSPAIADENSTVAALRLWLYMNAKEDKTK